MGTAADASTGGAGGDGGARASSGGDGATGSGSTGTSVDGGSPTGISVNGGSLTAPGATACGVIPGTFCDVQAITQTYACVTCHAATPVAGAPMSLITCANFLAPAKSNPAKTVAEMVLERTTARTMPPAGLTPVSDADEAKIQSWVAAGSSSSCGAPAPAAGCSADGGASTGTGTATGTGTGAGATDSGTATGTAGADAGGTGTAGVDAGTPQGFCAVQGVIQRNTCLNCHGATPINGAPMSLVTFADLTAPAKSDPTRTVGQLVIVRTTAQTMPPGGVPAVSAADIQTVQNWLDSGSLSTCATPVTPPPGGTGGTTTPDAGTGTADAGGTTTPPPPAGGGMTAINPVVGTSPNDPWCAVVRDVAPTCAACHASPPRGGAPMSLLTYADWIAHAVTQPAVIVGNLALTRISNGTMPPGGGATAAQIAAVQGWVNGGMANSACGLAGDAGAGAVDPFSSAPTCTSGQTMTTPDGPTMRPGEACLGCHTGGGGGDDNGGGGEDDDEAAAYALGGTVYPTAHEPNDCVGAVNGGGSVVTVIDAAGRTINLTPNAVGNFFYAGTITFPITARIAKNGLSRSMTTPQTSGNCNACHTLTGTNGAPGRILEPF
jgi:hypothetical protein